MPKNGKEPGTSIPVIGKIVRNEAGGPTSTTRLTSFRAPRDLTLGGNTKAEKPKKVYTPNLNVQRKKKEDVEPVKTEAKISRDKDRNRGKRFEDKGKGKLGLIQSQGVFSEGIGESQKRRYSSRSGTRESSDYREKTVLERPKLNPIPVIDKDEEERKLNLLLRDDFIDDGNEIVLSNAPVILPMNDEAKIYGERQVKIKPIKTDEDLDVKPVVENGEVLVDIKTPTCIKEDTKFTQSILEILESKSNNNYVLMQFPDCLPGLRVEDENETPSSSRRPHTGTEKPVEKPEDSYCTLSDLKEGTLGKLQILRSGKARLVLGENQLTIDVGSHLSFRQDLIAAKIKDSRQEGELINLGPLSSTLICSPDWETMLATL